MYPAHPCFILRPAHVNPESLAWHAPKGPAITGYLLFRALRTIESDEIEALYAGLLNDVVTTTPLGREATGIVDDLGSCDAWCLLVALSQTGDIIEVPLDTSQRGESSALPRLSGLSAQRAMQGHTCRPPKSHSNIYRDLPPLIFRDDTPEDKMRLASIRAGLARRFDGKPSD